MNLPENFVKRTSNLLGNEFQYLKKALEEAAPTSIRVNNKIDYHPSTERVPWCDSGYYLNERPLFTADPLFHAGVYYVQEASSMFLYQAVRQHFPHAQTVLDLCAAPGGKSTLLTQALPESSLLVSNEIVRSRAYILAENLIKWGNANIVVTNNEPKDFALLSGYFDALVVDAPCSGEGMFRKDSGAIQEWSEYNVTLCAARQREIVSSVWDSLKTEGILVYSTCTFNREENEENARWICEELGADLLTLDLNGNQAITTTDFGYRFYPHKTKGEGFFLTVLRKNSGGHSVHKNKRDDKKNIKPVTKSNVSTFSLIESDRWIIYPEDNLLKAYDKNRLNDFLFLNKQLKCMHSGLLLGEQKGTSFIPSPSIALSKKLDKYSVETAEVDYRTAISFLKKESILLPESSKGYILISYKGQALGWVKNLGNRTNNLYPQEWRIRMKL
ncbi:MAG: rRNA cytosine-C5-methyltransferase [Bacteroidota bacterium]|nr:rRNA cytosine-C5-methyltransferase [Bacteroidota bacterium]